MRNIGPIKLYAYFIIESSLLKDLKKARYFHELKKKKTHLRPCLKEDKIRSKIYLVSVNW